MGGVGEGGGRLGAYGNVWGGEGGGRRRDRGARGGLIKLQQIDKQNKIENNIFELLAV